VVSVRLWWIILLGLATARARAADGPRRVLLVHSFGRDYAPFHEVASRFRTELARLSPQPVEFLDTSLEMARFDGADRDRPLLDFLAAVFDPTRPDLVVAIGAPAAAFCSRHSADLFPGVPRLVVGLDRRREPGLRLGPESVAVAVDIRLSALRENILRVLPDTRHIYVVMGSAPLERYWEAELKREWAAGPDPPRIHWLGDQPLSRVLETVRNLPPHSAIFFGILNRDAAGIPHEHDSGLLALRQAASAPIFGFAEEQLGLGIVGGVLAPIARSGALAATAADALLAGTPPSEFRPDPIPMNPPVYDWRELKRWNIPEAILPPESTVRFRVPSLWASHRTAVTLAALLTGVQTTLIALLLAARRRARETDARLNLAAEAASVGLWERDVARDEIHATPRWRALFGLPEKGRLRLADVLRRVHPEDERTLREALHQATHAGGRYEVEHRVLLPNGGLRWIASSGRAEHGSGGQRLRTRGASLDITDRKRIEAEGVGQRAQLAHLSRVASLGVLSGALAHELNQPLGSILTNAQAAQRFLDRQDSGLPELREILADIVAEDRRAADVIRRLRALVERGESSRVAVDLNTCLGEVLRLVRSEIVGRGVTVRLDLEGGLPPVTADPIHLQQIFLNLVGNACDAMESRPRPERFLDIASRREDGSLQVAFHDRGVGLPPDPESLFEPFHTTKVRGLGLGLAICRMLVTAHGGHIRAEPNREGGATFRVSLPSVRSRGEPLMNVPATVGIVDDEPRMLAALRRLFAVEGYQVRAFGSADEFLRRPVGETIDCLVLDVSMPGPSGLDLQERLRRDGDRVPIVFLTGRGDIPMSVRAIKGGAVDFLSKPVEDSDLLAAVAAALAEASRRQAEDAELAAHRARLRTLTPRELEVLRHVIGGKLNKEIAADLGTSEQTIKVHRMRITAKMRMPAVADLVRTAHPTRPRPDSLAPPDRSPRLRPARARNGGTAS
jgi:FixJ family two-component response regulator/signal transduction histidine kinase